MGAQYWLWRWVVLLPATMSLAAERADMRLLEAAVRADVAAVRTLVQQGADVNVRYGDGATALHWAVHRDNGELADLLIRAGAAVNAANDLGVTPLWLAAQNGSAVMAERLLKAGANPNVRLPWGQTPLMEASRSGNVRVVQFLLDAGADVNATEKQYGQTALMWAAVEGHARNGEGATGVRSRRPRPFDLLDSECCQWQPKTAHFWQLKTAHFGEIHLGRSGRSPVDARRAFWAGRRERSDRNPGQNAPRSCAAGGHVATPSRCCSDAARSQC